MSKLSWLMLSEQDEGYRYIPQLGDEVVYLRQGHEEFIEKTEIKEGISMSIKRHIKAAEICKVAELEYSTCAGSGDSCCKLTLRFTDPLSSVHDKTIALTLPELVNFPDFIVEKTWYDASMSRNWSNRDKCLVWWWDENGGNWWEGRIISVQSKSNDFPDSPWEKYHIRYKDDSSHPHCPWELHDVENTWPQPHVDDEIRENLLSVFTEMERKDYYGIERLNDRCRKLDFVNRYPVPLYPELIRLRLEKNYYRSLEAIEHDVSVMLENTQHYFGKSDKLLTMLSRRFARMFSQL
jgi:PH-interacting protein